MVKYVRKRDGKVKPYSYSRIEIALEKAFLDAEKGEELCFEENKDALKYVIERELEDKGDIVDIEAIQDIVIDSLKELNFKTVSDSYSDYRRYRETERTKRSDREKFYKECLGCTNIDNDNANVNQASFSGRKSRISDYEQKMFALRNLISEEGRQAFESGSIYYHDLSSYAIGEHNCLNVDFDKLLKKGFRARNGDVRGANSFSTACQLVAVIFQCQSQVQYGGAGAMHLDFTLAPYVAKSFMKLFKEGVFEKYDIEWEESDSYIYIDSDYIKNKYPKAYDYAMRHLDKEGRQSTQALYHNLNTLESRAGSQVPFTSINLGRDISSEGRLVNKWIFEASKEGIGKFNSTSIFPISIFQYKKGVNDKEGTLNYDLKQLAIESLTKRIYPNIVNGDWLQNKEEEGNPDSMVATMGCRTLIGYNRHKKNYDKNGRGNINPMTIILPKLGIDYGIKRGERNEADVDGFMNELERVVRLVGKELHTRYEYCCSQSPKSAPFMYDNGTSMGAEDCIDSVRESLKNGTNAVGILGMAECCCALFGKHHGESPIAYEFALRVVERVGELCDEMSDLYDMNISQYFTPAENLCKTSLLNLRRQYGIIEGVTDRDYLTNSIHIPVYYQTDVYSKLTMEAPFSQYGKAGCITYVELDGDTVNNPKAIERIIDYAMDLNIVYLAINFPIDTCKSCGYSSQIESEVCPICSGGIIERLKRVTGYLTCDYRNFNQGKLSEVKDRVVHTIFNPDSIPVIKLAQKKLNELGVCSFEV